MKVIGTIQLCEWLQGVGVGGIVAKFISEECKSGFFLLSVCWLLLFQQLHMHNIIIHKSYQVIAKTVARLLYI